jgi:hypothetical protein
MASPSLHILYDNTYSTQDPSHCCYVRRAGQTKVCCLRLSLTPEPLNRPQKGVY